MKVVTSLSQSKALPFTQTDILALFFFSCSSLISLRDSVYVLSCVSPELTSPCLLAFKGRIKTKWC